MDPKIIESAPDSSSFKGEPFIKSSSFISRNVAMFCSHSLVVSFCKVLLYWTGCTTFLHATERRFLLSLHSIDECFVSLVLSSHSKVAATRFFQQRATASFQSCSATGYTVESCLSIFGLKAYAIFP